MRSKSVVIGYALAVILAAVFAFVFLRAFDARGPIWNGGWQLRVSGDAAPTASSVDLYAELTDLARSRELDVVRYVEDAEDPARIRHLFVAGDGVARELLHDGYGAVDTSVTTTVAPLLDLGALDARGAYLVGGERADAEAVLSAIEDAGWSGDVYPYASGIDIDTYREYGDLMRVLIVAALGIAVLVGAGTILRGRAHGVQRLHGTGFFGLLLGEWRFLALPVVTLWIGGVAAATGLLFALTGLAQTPTILALFVRLCGILLLSAVTAHVVAIALTDGRRIIHQIKGELDGWWVLLGVYSVRVPAVLVLLSVVVALGQSARVTDIESRGRQFWSTAGDAVTMGINGYGSENGLEAAIPGLASLVVSQASSGHALFVEQTMSEQRDVLLVDEGYLRAVEVLGDDGERVTQVSDSAITVLVPERTPTERSRAVLSDVRLWQEVQSHVAVPAPDTIDLPIEERAIPSGQQLFTFRALDFDPLATEMMLDDPIVVVLPSVSAVAPSELVSALTRGAVVFTDPQSVAVAVEQGGLSDVVSSITPVTYRASEQYQRALGTHSINVIGFIAGALVVLLTGLVAAVVLVEKDRKRAFVHRLSGLRPLSAHTSGYLLEAVMLTGTGVIAIVPLWLRDPRDVRTVLDLGTVDTETFVIEQTALALGIVVASAALLVACLALAHRRATRSPSDDF